MNNIDRRRLLNNLKVCDRSVTALTAKLATVHAERWDLLETAKTELGLTDRELAEYVSLTPASLRVGRDRYRARTGQQP